MIINGNINNDNEDKEVDDMLALLQAIRDYVISIAEKRGFPSTIAMLRLDEILTACGSNDSNVSHENAVKMDKLSLFALGAAQVLRGLLHGQHLLRGVTRRGGRGLPDSGQQRGERGGDVGGVVLAHAVIRSRDSDAVV